ncbi:conserved hypothetical protein [Xenorhabdus nematophila F1]|uniref:Uncharacterized protein n=1 Tax=Xenorhabdus nematophila (strain ATCC 19061 / DSM 3370 / CCUG 14189 / LMG 1036 / NCIMB 9965 / AN6) TaxID=406817 RepID=D3VF35_XENNA|nr:hypothetical protein XNC1_4470 [Xenorhabdus nematophila ATCC 19061]CCW31334.1 conserved hypothetical protein [Xenorhabdus nematophila F1]CEE90959.1 hypothetical protein XNA1_1840022 [Xenorhabdus nematophila str. Anatoliense]CEF29129.1 hypothetical protein XNW1_1570021 [Xenorhabdus nematophila str. Websteri]CEK25307.1 hypothetical protein XNC2_4320 [Xenorhabdus nematophila AN6/1]
MIELTDFYHTHKVNKDFTGYKFEREIDGKDNRREPHPHSGGEY